MADRRRPRHQCGGQRSVTRQLQRGPPVAGSAASAAASGPPKPTCRTSCNGVTTRGCCCRPVRSRWAAWGRLLARTTNGEREGSAAVPVPARVPDQRGDHAAAGEGQVARRGDVPPGPRLPRRAVPRRRRVLRGRRLRPALLRVVPVRRRGFPQVQELGQVLLLRRGADGQRRAVRRTAGLLTGCRHIRGACRAPGTGIGLEWSCEGEVRDSYSRGEDSVAGKIKCPSLHFIGDEDFVKIHSEELVEAFADPLVIRHPCGHTVPKLDEKGLQVMLSYLYKIERELSDHA